MSTILRTFDNRRSTIESSVLPPTFMQAFSVDNEHARCIKCNYLCKYTASNTFFHLTVCNGSLVEENFQTDIKLNCLMCNFSTKNIDTWKNHLFQLQHISKLNPYLYATKYSYDCGLCRTHFYGSEDEILKHLCKPIALSMFSKFMVYVYYHFDIHNKRMLYYCADCKHYSYTLTDLHIKKCCKSIGNQDSFVCDSCLITIYNSCKDTFLNHEVSFQHLVLWCLNGNRSKPKTLASMHWKLPSFMSNFFVISTILQKVCCNVCNNVIALKYDSIYNHYIQCISSKDISEIEKTTPLCLLICSLCDYQYSSPEEDLYKDWVQHVISLDHLKKTKEKRHGFNLFTYYCFVNETVYYGTKSYIVQQILKNNADVGRLLFVSEVMAQVYKRSNTYSCKIKGNVLYICGFCESSTEDQSEYCEHAKIDSNPKLNCSSCLVVFNVKSDYIEHLISSEHIILRYFNPNQLSELKILEHSMNTLKMNLSSLIESDDDMSGSLSDTSSLDELSLIPQPDSVEFDCNDWSSKTYYTPPNVSEDNLSINSEQSQSLLTEQCKWNSENDSSQFCLNAKHTKNIQSYNPEIDLSNFIEKLSVQSEKSAFNHHLRMHFELLNQMPLAMNVFVELKSFFCTVCDIIHCDFLKWTQHVIEFHSQLDLSVFYCAICQIYQTGTSFSKSKHLETIEHSVMSEFQEYKKKNKNLIINNANYENNLIAANDDVKNNCNYNNNTHHNVATAADDNPTNTKENKHQINNNIYIEFKDVNKHFKVKKYRLLRTLLRDKYGEFEIISKTSNSCIILFQTIKQVNRLIKDKKNLMKEHGLKAEDIKYNNDKFKTIDFITDWCIICKQISNKLDKINEQNSQIKINKLCKAIRNLNVEFDLFDVHVFGSQGYGLATEKSDVDLILEIDGTLDCDINRAVCLVEMFAQQLDLKPKEFKDVKILNREISVPIIKFYHIPTDFNCDISFNGGLALYNTKLIKYYLSMNPTVKWLACIIVQNWAVKNNLIDKNMFSKHQLIWLVLFYLMEEQVVPPVFELMKNVPINDHIIVEGWDCSFGEWSGKIKDQNRPKLLLGFFQYYTNKMKFMYYVLCTFTGKCMKKNNFFTKFSKLSAINETQRAMFKNLQSNISLDFKNCIGLAVQHPFKLSRNLIEKIDDNNLTNFCDKCDKTITLLINTKCYNTF